MVQLHIKMVIDEMYIVLDSTFQYQFVVRVIVDTNPRECKKNIKVLVSE